MEREAESVRVPVPRIRVRGKPRWAATPTPCVKLECEVTEGGSRWNDKRADGPAIRTRWGVPDAWQGAAALEKPANRPYWPFVDRRQSRGNRLTGPRGGATNFGNRLHR